jgi:hypothetical protein
LATSPVWFGGEVKKPWRGDPPGFWVLRFGV